MNTKYMFMTELNNPKQTYVYSKNSINLINNFSQSLLRTRNMSVH